MPTVRSCKVYRDWCLRIICIALASGAFPWILCAETGLHFADSGQFELDNGKAVPSADIWFHSGVEVVSGAVVHGGMHAGKADVQARNSSTHTLRAPVHRLNRLGPDGADRGAENRRGGDTLLSGPINLSRHYGAALSFAYRRGNSIPPTSGNRNWADSVLAGPEARIIAGNDPHALAARPDNLLLEFALTHSTDAIIPDSAWNRHVRPDGKGFIRDNPALTVFGAGGIRRGFDETRPNTSLTREQGLRIDLQDVGLDEQFHKATVRIPDWMIEYADRNSLYFRFRFRVDAADNSRPDGAEDDDDAFYLAHVTIFSPDREADLEIIGLRLKKRYAVDRAHGEPFAGIEATIANNDEESYREIWAEYQISFLDAGFSPIVARRKSRLILPLAPYATIVVPISVSWPDAVGFSKKAYALRVAVRLVEPYADNGEPEPRNYYPRTLRDANPDNNIAWLEDTLYFEDSPSYVRAAGPGVNAVPAYADRAGHGIGLPVVSKADSTWPEHRFGGGESHGAGWLAVQYRIHDETLRGYQAWLGAMSDCSDSLEFAVFAADSSGMPGAMIEHSHIVRRRCFDVSRGEDIVDDFSYYPLTKPLALTRGDYWIGVRQRNNVPLHLGASDCGAGTLRLAVGTAPGDSTARALQALYSAYRITDWRKGYAENPPRFAYRNDGDGIWTDFMNTAGDPAYGHYGEPKTWPADSVRYAGGTWLPLVKPVFYPVPLVDELYRTCGALGFTVSAAGLEWMELNNSNNLSLTVDTLEHLKTIRFDFVLIDTSVTGSFHLSVQAAEGKPLDIRDTIAAVHGPIKIYRPDRYSDSLYTDKALRYQWYRNGEVIPGAVNRVHFARGSAVYAVQSENSYGCTARSEAFEYFERTRVENACRETSFRIRLSYNNPRLSIIDSNNVAIFLDTAGSTVRVVLRDTTRSGRYRLRSSFGLIEYEGTLFNPAKAWLGFEAREHRIHARGELPDGYMSYAWYHNGHAISKAHRSTLVAETPGEYTLRVNKLINPGSLTPTCASLLGPVFVRPQACGADTFSAAEPEWSFASLDSSSRNVDISIEWNHETATARVGLVDSTRSGWYALASWYATDTVYFMGRIDPLPPLPRIRYDEHSGELVGIVDGNIASYGLRWLVNGDPIDSALNRRYLPAGNGLYSFMLRDTNGCERVSAPFDYRTVAVPGLREKNSAGVAVWPHPFSNTMAVYYTTTVYVRVECSLLDMFGRLLVRAGAHPQKSGRYRLVLGTSGLPAGPYLCRLTIGETALTLPVLLVR